MTKSKQLPIPPTWHEYFMALAYLTASKSKDPSTKVGAVIVAEGNSIISTGYNGLPRGVNDDPKIYERYHQRPSKYAWYEHAERNAIYNAARQGIALSNTIIFTPGLPCTDCARGIIQSGIGAIFTHKEWREETTPLVTKDQSWYKIQQKVVYDMLLEAGVDLFELSLNLPSSTGFFNGQRIPLKHNPEEQIPF